MQKPWRPVKKSSYRKKSIQDVDPIKKLRKSLSQHHRCDSHKQIEGPIEELFKKVIWGIKSQLSKQEEDKNILTKSATPA